MLRLVLNDHAEQAARARELFQGAVSEEMLLVVSEGVLAECAWVLRRRMQVPAARAAKHLLAVLRLANVEGDAQDLFEDALERMATTEHDLVDCLLAARGASEGVTIASFDKHLRRQLDLQVWPER